MKNVGLVLSAISIIGGLFNAFGKIVGFWIWIVANILWICYDIYFKLYSQIPMFVFYCITSIVGIVVWKKKEKNVPKTKQL